MKPIRKIKSNQIRMKNKMKIIWIVLEFNLILRIMIAMKMVKNHQKRN